MKGPDTRAVRWGILGAALVAAVLFAGCALTVQQERDLGVQFSRQVEREMRTVHDPVVVGYVRGIGDRLVAAAGPQPFPFTFGVVDDPKVNAFAGPGGYVYVHTGLLLKARNVSEVAAVMAHEISHVTLRHVSQAVARQEQAAILGAGVAMVSDNPTLGQVAGTGLSIYNLHYDRQAEADADRNGVLLMQRAGYDPNGMITMFRLLESEGGRQGGGFLSSHPSTGDRIERLQSYVRTLPRGGLIRDDGRLAAIQARIRSDEGRYGRSTGALPGGPGPYDGGYNRGGQGSGGYGGGTGVDPNGYPNGGYGDPYGR
jgi:predicted Zn-dependent protease